jgi:hypothetical protein
MEDVPQILRENRVKRCAGSALTYALFPKRRKALLGAFAGVARI